MSYVDHISQPEAPRLTQERDAQYWLDLAQGARLQAEQVIYADSRSVDHARERLAKLILSLLSDTQDPAEIKAIAVQEMTKGL